jgi:hypothetical protein
MGYERSNGGPGGISALEPMAGLSDDCGCGCLFGDDDMPVVPTARTWMQPGVMVPTAHTGGVVPSGYAQQAAEARARQAAQQAAECYHAQKMAAIAKMERSRLCATHTAEGVPIAHTAQSAAACAHAQKMELVAQMERARRCGR